VSFAVSLERTKILGMVSTIDRSVRVVDVTKTYPIGGSELVALDRVSLDLAAGEISAIVGRSGSGKSTLLNLVAGIDRPRSGRVVVAGTRVDDLGESALAAWRGRNVGVVFQFFELLPTLTVLENVLLPIDFCRTLPPKRAKERAIALLDLVGIADQAHKLPPALSGGQQQRAAIARALANDPPVVVADEPTGNLDSQTGGAVLELLVSLARAGKTVMLVTHASEIASIVDRVVTLADGRIASDVRRAAPLREASGA
jgi:putative ABC transport system ATP-binding protein